MRVLIAGATGFIGRALIPLLQREGHSVIAWVRSEASARGRLGADVELAATGAGFEAIVGGASVTISPASAWPEGAEGARHELRATTMVDAPLAETFAFFSRAANLGLITPPGMQFAIQGPIPPMAKGATIDYRVRAGPLPVRWRTRIIRWEPGRSFVDLQESGPYRLWWHEHTFRADGERTVMEDRVCYSPPLGILGRVANRFFIGSTLKKIFQYEAT